MWDHVAREVATLRQWGQRSVRGWLVCGRVRTHAYAYLGSVQDLLCGGPFALEHLGEVGVRERLFVVCGLLLLLLVALVAAAGANEVTRFVAVLNDGFLLAEVAA